MKQHWMIGNKHSVKNEEPATSFLQVRVTPAQKAAWVKKAHPKKLSEWVIEKLNTEENKMEQVLSLDHPDRALTRFDEITLHDMVRENVGALQGLLRVKTMNLPDNDPIHLKVDEEVKKLQDDYRVLDIKDSDKLKAFSQYLYARLKEVDSGEI